MNAICPGWVLTPLVEKQIHAKAAQEKLSFEEASSRLLAEKQPSRSFATPEQVHIQSNPPPTQTPNYRLVSM